MLRYPLCSSEGIIWSCWIQILWREAVRHGDDDAATAIGHRAKRRIFGVEISRYETSAMKKKDGKMVR